MYEQPETRIEVQTNPGVWPHERYYAQYKQVVIPWVWEEWYTISGGIKDSFGYTCSLEEAKERVDHFLRSHKDDYDKSQMAKLNKKVKVRYEFIPYP